MAYPATPKTWVAGDVLTAAQLNAELRDALLGAFPLGPPDVAWTAYTPTLVQPGAVTKTVTYARYTRTGRKITAQVLLTVTGTGTAANSVVVGLPVTAAQASDLPCGVGIVTDSSAGGATFGGIALINSTTTVYFLSTATNIGLLGVADFTAALAVGDTVRMSITYESAT